jgi:hypothetical protein
MYQIDINTILTGTLDRYIGILTDKIPREGKLLDLTTRGQQRLSLLKEEIGFIVKIPLHRKEPIRIIPDMTPSVIPTPGTGRSQWLPRQQDPHLGLASTAVCQVSVQATCPKLLEARCSEKHGTV